MSKNSTAVSEAQIQPNPTVLIRYQPENAPLVLAENATAMLVRINSAKPITSPQMLEKTSEIISDAQITAGEVETFIESLRSGIQKACERVRELKGYEDFEASLTIRKWSLRQLLTTGISNLKAARANYLDAEERKRQQAQREADEKQRKINEAAAKQAAAAAKSQGADKATVQEIKQEVLATPAPVVESRAQTVAQASGVSLRYTYSAEITSLKSFLGAALNNPVLFNTLVKAVPDIEKAFGAMARDQRELFNFPGMTYKKTPVDVGRGRK